MFIGFCSLLQKFLISVLVDAGAEIHGVDSRYMRSKHSHGEMRGSMHWVSCEFLKGVISFRLLILELEGRGIPVGLV